MVSKRHAKANNPYVADYNPDKESNYIMYYDANNLYGSTDDSGFKWLTKNKDRKFDRRTEGKGRIFEMDLEYPKHLHKLHNNYPLAPEKLSVKDTPAKACCTAPMNKKNYVVHYRTLQSYIEQGMKVTKIHRVLEFKEKPWMEPYIRLNTDL